MTKGKRALKSTAGSQAPGLSASSIIASLFIAFPSLVCRHDIYHGTGSPFITPWIPACDKGPHGVMSPGARATTFSNAALHLSIPVLRRQTK